MTQASTPVRIYVYYAGPAKSRFDREYYVGSHLPIVTDAWAKYGLISVRAFFPPEDESGTLAICECLFRDDSAVEAAFSSDEAPAVMADVAQFTDIAPKQLRAVPLGAD